LLCEILLIFNRFRLIHKCDRQTDRQIRTATTGNLMYGEQPP